MKPDPKSISRASRQRHCQGKLGNVEVLALVLAAALCGAGVAKRLSAPKSPAFSVTPGMVTVQTGSQGFTVAPMTPSSAPPSGPTMRSVGIMRSRLVKDTSGKPVVLYDKVTRW
jgi:hypothetical protein